VPSPLSWERGDAIPLAAPSIWCGDREAVGRALVPERIIDGKEIAAFEPKISAYVGDHPVVPVSSGTASVYLALVVEELGASGICLPCSTSITDEQMRVVIEKVLGALGP
jgi:dTDP-4-amino-4,6-dideoxygalactose transaminase